MLSTQADTLKRIESRLANNRASYTAVSDENEDRATVFVTSLLGPGRPPFETTHLYGRWGRRPWYFKLYKENHGVDLKASP